MSELSASFILQVTGSCMCIFANLLYLTCWSSLGTEGFCGIAYGDFWTPDHSVLQLIFTVIRIQLLFTHHLCRYRTISEQVKFPRIF